MATYAVLGSTGQVGGSVIQVLLEDGDKTIRVHARSKKKLFGMHPEWESLPNLAVFEGGLDDAQMLTDFISGSKAVFLAAAASNPVPGTTVAQQQTAGIIAAMELLRKQDPHTRLPLLVVLSSASLNHEMMPDTPQVARGIVYRAFAHIYEDLRKAEKTLRAQDWIKQVYIKPGGLVHDKAHGHVVAKTEKSFLSFIDLAGGMVEVAESDDDRYDMQNVSVQPATEGTRFEPRVPWFVLKGLIFYFFPGLYPYLGPYLP